MHIIGETRVFWWFGDKYKFEWTEGGWKIISKQQTIPYEIKRSLKEL